jgi:hypothetical protein
MTGSRRPKLTVLGLGYLGASHAACLAELGFEVFGVHGSDLGQSDVCIFTLAPLLRSPVSWWASTRCPSDGRPVLDPDGWREAGWSYRGPGRPETESRPGQAGVFLLSR